MLIVAFIAFVSKIHFSYSVTIHSAFRKTLPPTIAYFEICGVVPYLLTFSQFGTFLDIS